MTDAPKSGDWPEDFSHENGNYTCTCCECGRTFTGHKRRVVCKVCAKADAPTPRTDAIRQQAYEANDPRELWEIEYAKLERDLAAAQERVRVLSEAAVNDGTGRMMDCSSPVAAAVADYFQRMRDAESALASEREARERAERAIASAKSVEFFHDGLSGDLLDCKDKASAYVLGYQEAFVAIDSAIAQAEKETKNG